MQNSQEFIDICITLKKKEIDSSRTLDTLMEDGKDYSISIDEENSFSLPRSRSPPKSPRRSSLQLGEQLKEI